jgi:spore germination cell wall hydrolase CwlJ-like protein
MVRLVKFSLILLAAVLVAFIARTAINYKLNKNETIQKTSHITAEVRNKQLDCLAQNIYYEAGWEPFEGKVAVAQVTLNRVRSGQFPSDVCGVIHQKNIFYNKVICQFSWYCNSPAIRKPMNQAAYRESYEVAKQVLLEGFRLPSLTTALYYHADYIDPKWGKKQVAKIGQHIFYN